MKKATAYFVLGMFLLGWPIPSYAQEPRDTPVAVSTPEPDIVVLKAGDPAPFTGVLVPEVRFTRYLELDMKVQDLEGRLKIQMKLGGDLDLYYTKQMAKLAEPPAWYQGTELNRWVGFFIGVGVTALALWGAHELIGANL